jgi:glycosyltransferase involved in cell wall biosynthesis
LLVNWNYTEIPCAIVTFFNKNKSAQFHDMKGPKWIKTFALKGAKQPDPIVKISKLYLPTAFGLRYFFSSLVLFFLNPGAIAYINNTPYAHLPAIVAAALMKKKIICHLRSMNELTRLERLLISAINRFIVLTLAAKEYYMCQGIPEYKIEVVYDSIDLKGFSGNTSSVGNQASPMAIVIGSLFFMKGQDICLKALALVREYCPDVRLTLVGEGYYENELKLLAHSLGIENCVIFTGYCDQIPKILKKHSIGILTSRKEGLPNCVQEYMAVGLPVIVSDLPGIRELVDDGASGFIVPQESPEKLAERWIELLKNEDLRSRMGNRGKQIVEEERFDPKTEMRQIVDVIQSCWRT